MAFFQDVSNVGKRYVMCFNYLSSSNLFKLIFFTLFRTAKLRIFSELAKKETRKVSFFAKFCRSLYPLGESNPHLKFRKLPFYPLN